MAVHVINARLLESVDAFFEIYAEDGDRNYLIAGQNVTSFSWKEDKLAKRDHAVPSKR